MYPILFLILFRGFSIIDSEHDALFPIPESNEHSTVQLPQQENTLDQNSSFGIHVFPFAYGYKKSMFTGKELS